MKSAEAYKGSALGWLRSRVPDSFVKAKDAYTQRVVETFKSFKVNDAVAFAKEQSKQGYLFVTVVRGEPCMRSFSLHRGLSFRVLSPPSRLLCCRRRVSSSRRARRTCRRSRTSC